MYTCCIKSLQLETLSVGWHVSVSHVKNERKAPKGCPDELIPTGKRSLIIKVYYLINANKNKIRDVKICDILLQLTISFYKLNISKKVDLSPKDGKTAFRPAWHLPTVSSCFSLVNHYWVQENSLVRLLPLKKNKLKATTKAKTFKYCTLFMHDSDHREIPLLNLCWPDVCLCNSIIRKQRHSVYPLLTSMTVRDKSELKCLKCSTMYYSQNDLIVYIRHSCNYSNVSPIRCIISENI